MSEILTVTELAALLKVSKRHIHELTKDRTRTGEMRRHPLPAVSYTHLDVYKRQMVSR